jgi:hypothetical protein
MCMFCRSLFDFFFLFLLPLLSVLPRFTGSDYPFGIFKLFFNRKLKTSCVHKFWNQFSNISVAICARWPHICSVCVISPRICSVCAKWSRICSVCHRQIPRPNLVLIFSPSRTGHWISIESTWVHPGFYYYSIFGSLVFCRPLFIFSSLYFLWFTSLDYPIGIFKSFLSLCVTFKE